LKQKQRKEFLQKVPKEFSTEALKGIQDVAKVIGRFGGSIIVVGFE